MYECHYKHYNFHKLKLKYEQHQPSTPPSFLFFSFLFFSFLFFLLKIYLYRLVVLTIVSVAKQLYIIGSLDP